MNMPDCEKEEKLSSMSAAVRKVIDAYPAGFVFHGNELKRDVVEIYPDAVNMYPDTILRMARRHRRYAFCVEDQNKSLYKKLKVKSVSEELAEIRKETALEAEPPAEPPKQSTQMELPLFSQVFLVGFFVVFLGVFLPGVSTFGRPLAPPSFIASKSSSLYIPTGPMYLNGRMPFLCNLLFTPSEDMPSIWAMSTAVNSFIHRSITFPDDIDQVINGKMFRNWDILLYECIVKNQKTFKKPQNSLLELDSILWQGYSLYMFYYRNTRTLKKRQPEAPVAEWPKAKGEFYERVQKFSGMA